MATSISRRGLLGSAAAFAGTSLLQAKTLKTVGVQLYTVRSVIGKNPKTKETVEAIEQIGLSRGRMHHAEPRLLSTAALKETRIKPVSLHLDTVMFMKQPGQAPRLHWITPKSKGFEYVVCPYIPPADRGGEDVMRRLGGDAESGGATRCNQNGLKLCYHNHAFEFEPVRAGSVHPPDVPMQTADPKLASLELDVMWARVAGVYPVTGRFCRSTQEGRTDALERCQQRCGSRGTTKEFHEISLKKSAPAAALTLRNCSRLLRRRVCSTTLWSRIRRRAIRLCRFGRATSIWSI